MIIYGLSTMGALPQLGYLQEIQVHVSRATSTQRDQGIDTGFYFDVNYSYALLPKLP